MRFEADTVEGWAERLITTTRLDEKITPPAPPARWSPSPAALVIDAPGRPPELVARTHKRKRPRNLADPLKRAEVLHTFFHHELQAAELFAWALLAFPQTPLGFRKGLLGICVDELRHLGLYAAHLRALGSSVGAYPINDWFWQRVPCDRPETFVARLSIGFEGGNLDHGARFTEAFSAAGDDAAADLQALITREEEAHAAFGLHWFARFTGTTDFAQWRGHLPKPLSPVLTRGTPLNLEARRRAGYPESFLQALEAWTIDDP